MSSNKTQSLLRVLAAVLAALLPPVGLVSRRGVRVKGKQDALDAYVLFALP